MDKIEKLVEKIDKGTATQSEIDEYYKLLGVSDIEKETMIFVSSPDYGKPDKDGIITII